MQKNNIKNISFINANIFDDLFKSNKFDLIICNGVLHHTETPKEGFDLLCNYLKPGGIVIVGLYNRYGRLQTYLRKFIYKFINKRFALFLDPYLKKNSSISRSKKLSWEKDQYDHPLESAHTYDEVLKWFKTNKIEFLNYLPNELLDQNENIFTYKIQSNFYVRMCEQIYMNFTKYSQEGGLFIFIGKKLL